MKNTRSGKIAEEYLMIADLMEKTLQGGVVMAVNEAAVLIEAVKRYVRSETYPSVETICSILGIEEGKKCETQSEKQKRDQ